MSLYLYALVGRPVRRPLGRGLGGETLRLIEVAGLLVVAARVGDAPRVTPTALRRHDATVRRLAGRTDAVLPIRFGTVVGDRLALARALAPRAAGLREALALVAGHEQMTLRVYGEAVTTSDESAAESAGAGQSGSSATSDRRCWPASTTSSGAATASAIWPRSPRPALGWPACV